MMKTLPITLALPTGVTPHHLATSEGLRAWWDPDATIEAGRASPGLDAEVMTVARDGDAVIWTGEHVTARFSEGRATIDAPGLDAPGLDAPGLDAEDREELVLAWEFALATLRWAIGAPGTVSWRRVALPLALAYTDAWGRIAGPEGLGAGTVVGEHVAVRIAGARVDARVVLARPPRAVLLAVGGALLRVGFGPGESVNAANVDVLGDADALPEGWEAWIARRFGMTWVAQLGEEG